MASILMLLPEWHAAQWFNTRSSLRLADLRGKVVLVHAFQMLCPGCVAHGLPQASRVHETFGGQDVAVVGLHCVFEHHEAMRPYALQAFIQEYRLRFPIGVDAPSSDGPVPRTMAQWRLRGTPSTLLLDREGRLRLHHFGALDELRLGAAIGRLLVEPHAAAADFSRNDAEAGSCAEGVCATSK
jgi:peroxiredoxin